MVVDVGTGDGRSVVRRARQEPDTLFIGLDAAAEPLREASQRASRPFRRGGVPNALFLVGAAERLPGHLAGRANEVTISLPWGSLLRGLVLAEPAMVCSVAGLLAPAGRVELLLSVTGTDASTGLPALDETAMHLLAAAYRDHGLDCLELRSATAGDIERLSSSWARRLGIPAHRQAWLVRFGPSQQPKSGAL